MSVWDESPLPPPVNPAVPPPADPAVPPPPVPPGPPAGPGTPPDDGDDGSGRRILGLPVWLVAAVGLVLCGVVAVAVFATGSDDDPPATDAVGATETTDVSPPSAAADPDPTAPATVPVTSAPAPATTGDTTTSTPEPPATTTTTGTTPPTTTTATTSTTGPTSSTAAPTTTIGDQPGVSISGPTTVTGDDGRRLTVTPRIDACRGEPECLVVAFEIDGFPSQPTTFVCEFASGNRYQFRFGSDRVETACSTGDTPDSIVVEVDGLRSEPITISD